MKNFIILLYFFKLQTILYIDVKIKILFNYANGMIDIKNWDGKFYFERKEDE